MQQMTFVQARQWLKENIDIRTMLTPSKGRDFYICPFCGSGTGKHATSAAKYHSDSNKLYCNKCHNSKIKKGRSADAIDIYQHTTGAAGHAAAVFEMADKNFIEIVDPDHPRPGQTRKEPPKIDFQRRANVQPLPAKPAPEYDFTAYIEACAQHITDPAAVEYLTGKRGLAMATIQRIQPPIGYDAASDPANAPGGAALKDEDGSTKRTFPARRIILPTSKRFYMGRAIDDKTRVQKSNAKDATPEPFNAAALDSDAPEIFISEGAFTALSIMDAGGPKVEAIALNGAGQGSRLLKALEGRATDKVFIVCFDNEPIEGSTPEELKKAQDKHDDIKAEGEALVNDLQNMGYYAMSYEINGTCNDANDRLRADRTGLVDAIRDAQQQAAAYKQEAHETASNAPNPALNGNPNELPAESAKTAQNAPKLPASAQSNADKEKGQTAADEEKTPAQRRAELKAQRLDRAAAFYSDTDTLKFEPIPTGIDWIDDILGGGIVKQSLVVLGAAPGAGKTALAAQLFEAMARQGRETMFFNLEMGREQLYARTIAREMYDSISAKKGRHQTTALEVMRRYQMDAETRERCEAAYQDCMQHVFPYLDYNPSEAGNLADVTTLLNTISEAADLATAAGEPAPMVCIDYLQLLTGEDKEDIKRVIGRAVTGLKQYARKYDSIAMVIVAQSREANRDDNARLDGGRDSSNIEYSADLFISLTNQKNADDMGQPTLNVVKNRFGAVRKGDNGIALEFNLQAGHFEPTADYYEKLIKAQEAAAAAEQTAASTAKARAEHNSLVEQMKMAKTTP